MFVCSCKADFFNNFLNNTLNRIMLNALDKSSNFYKMFKMLVWNFINIIRRNLHKSLPSSVQTDFLVLWNSSLEHNLRQQLYSSRFILQSTAINTICCSTSKNHMTCIPHLYLINLFRLEEEKQRTFWNINKSCNNQQTLFFVKI